MSPFLRLLIVASVSYSALVHAQGPRIVDQNKSKTATPAQPMPVTPPGPRIVDQSQPAKPATPAAQPGTPGPKIVDQEPKARPSPLPPAVKPDPKPESPPTPVVPQWQWTPAPIWVAPTGGKQPSQRAFSVPPLHPGFVEMSAFPETRIRALRLSDTDGRPVEWGVLRQGQPIPNDAERQQVEQLVVQLWSGRPARGLVYVSEEGEIQYSGGSYKLEFGYTKDGKPESYLEDAVERLSGQFGRHANVVSNLPHLSDFSVLKGKRVYFSLDLTPAQAYEQENKIAKEVAAFLAGKWTPGIAVSPDGSLKIGDVSVKVNFLQETQGMAHPVSVATKQRLDKLFALHRDQILVHHRKGVRDHLIAVAKLRGHGVEKMADYGDPGPTVLDVLNYNEEPAATEVALANDCGGYRLYQDGLGRSKLTFVNEDSTDKPLIRVGKLEAYVCLDGHIAMLVRDPMGLSGLRTKSNPKVSNMDMSDAVFGAGFVSLMVFREDELVVTRFAKRGVFDTVSVEDPKARTFRVTLKLLGDKPVRFEAYDLLVAADGSYFEPVVIAQNLKAAQ